MTKQDYRTKVASFFSDGFVFVGGTLVAVLVFLAIWSFISPNPSFSTIMMSKSNTLNSKSAVFNLNQDSQEPTFYDDQDLNYGIEKPIKNWDEKRSKWLKLHPTFNHGVKERILVVSGSQSMPCKNPMGDHLLLRFYKNKPKMFFFWAKMPAVRAAMVAHPEAEWIWWVDSDAAFTDMDFKLPLEKYKDHNFVVYGWPKLIYEKKSWTGLNAGVFLIRNCQWSMDLIEAWAKMGPQSTEYDKWGQILQSTFKDKNFPQSDDQSGLSYLLLKEKDKWGDKIYLESEYYFQGYWVDIVGQLNNITDKYLGIEKKMPSLRRRHAEKVSERYGKLWEEYLIKDKWRRPFITHFTGCEPCSGDHNPIYSWETCYNAMQKALNFADNQVLRKYGFVHKDLLDSSSVSPLPFDFPSNSSV
ncbi:putative glycosyltransferase 7 isoform X2 [Nicotiana sylvestris]|uniref:Glycosyltransferase 7 isoform X2 n=1 Tax=Nicotiana sylvestris TaxID=4096 RepID=A0A1U7WTD6_NICSY|nr:PREDICTED: putative glycosyltransferase 7 isoform X2 [Nicotiana sylvestris]